MTTKDLEQFIALEQLPNDIKIHKETELHDGATLVLVDFTDCADFTMCKFVPFIYFKSQGEVFSPDDWQGSLCTEYFSEEDIKDIQWRNSNNEIAVILNGLPRIF